MTQLNLQDSKQIWIVHHEECMHECGGREREWKCKSEMFNIVPLECDVGKCNSRCRSRGTTGELVLVGWRAQRDLRFLKCVRANSSNKDPGAVWYAVSGVHTQRAVSWPVSWGCVGTFCYWWTVAIQWQHWDFGEGWIGPCWPESAITLHHRVEWYNIHQLALKSRPPTEPNRLFTKDSS